MNWKDTFNLARKPKKKVSAAQIVLAIGIILAVFAVAKFAFFDRYSKLADLKKQAESALEKVDANNEEIKRIEADTEDFAHFTDAEMTEEELELVDRAELLRMVDKRIRPFAKVRSWTLEDNVLRVQIDKTTLEKVNKIVTEMDKEELVDYSYMQTAAGDNEELQPGAEVSADMTTYLKLPAAEEEEEKKDEIEIPENYLPMRINAERMSEKYYFEMDSAGNVLRYFLLTVGDDKAPSWTEISESEAYKGIEEEEKEGMRG